MIKKAIIVFMFIFTFIFCTASPFAKEDKKQVPVVLSTHHRPPFSYFIKGIPHKKIADSSFKGTAVDVVRCAFKRMDIPLEIHIHPWQRAQQLAKEGKVDGFFSASHHQERDDYAVMSDIIATQHWNWILRAGTPLSPKDVTFKEKAKVTSFAGSNMLKWLYEEKYNIPTEARDSETLFNLLLTHQVDAVIESQRVLKEVITPKNKDKFKIYVAKNKPLGIYFTKKFLKESHFSMKMLNQNIQYCRKENKELSFR